MRFHVITLFPETFSYLNSSLIKRAQEKNKISVRFESPRDFASDKHKTVDEKSYGGGPGMVMKAEPLARAIKDAKSRLSGAKVILLSPAGTR